jgi:hypothetical protein
MYEPDLKPDVKMTLCKISLPIPSAFFSTLFFVLGLYNECIS